MSIELFAKLLFFNDVYCEKRILNKDYFCGILKMYKNYYEKVMFISLLDSSGDFIMIFFNKYKHKKNII